LNRLAALKIALITVLVLLSFGYGLAVGRKQYPPYATVHWAYEYFFESQTERKYKNPQYTTVNPEFYKNDLDALITIRSEADVVSKRKQLEDYIWPGRGFPQTEMPSEVNRDIQDEKCQNLAGLKRIDRVVVRMDYGLDSVMYHFIPEKNNQQLVIYHAGHFEDFRDASVVISSLLSQGYAVLGVSMPLMGLNSRPFFDSDHNGRFLLVHHNQFLYLKDPIRFFIDPVVIALNYVSKAVGYESITMLGFSGGAWTTTMCAALDPRIMRSYPVAGTLPFFLVDPRGWGDYEQMIPDLYRVANYLELYVLGSYGEDRKQMQVLNQFDECCYYGLGYQIYEQKVKSAVAALKKGSFEVLLDTTHHEHKLSDYSLKMIIHDLGRQRSL